MSKTTKLASILLLPLYLIRTTECWNVPNRILRVHVSRNDSFPTSGQIAFSRDASSRLATHLRMSEELDESSSDKQPQSEAAREAADEFVKPSSEHRNITAIVEKKIRVAKAQSEIDRILKGPDAPFDAEEELKKVVSIAPPVLQSLAEEELEAGISHLEHDLYQAVKQQDYAKAEDVKREISQMHIDDCGAVLQINAAFYRAFSNKDFETMQSLWLKDGTSTCIHPSSKPLVGSKAVLNSWKRMFESAEGSFQRSWMEPRDIRLSIKGASTAIVTCDEHVYARRFVRGKKRQTELVNKLTATNVFRKVSGKWYLIHHHASWHADSDIAKKALRGASVLGGNKPRLLVRSQMQGRSDTAEDGEISMDGILGMDKFGPLLGSEGGENKKPFARRIISGSLSGSLSDLLNGVNLGKDNGAFIQFSKIGEEEEDSADFDLEQVDNEEQEDDEVENKDTSESEITIIKQWAEASDSSTNSQDQSSSSSGVSTSNSDSEPKDALRQDCIAALRKLCNQGSISPKQKRVLLTDIITCSAKGEFSMVEVAYELLCGEGDDKEAAEEEFAEQCRVFAHSLPETPPISYGIPSQS